MKFSYRGLPHSALPQRSSDNHSGRAASSYFGNAFLQQEQRDKKRRKISLCMGNEGMIVIRSARNSVPFSETRSRRFARLLAALHPLSMELSIRYAESWPVLLC